MERLFPFFASGVRERNSGAFNVTGSNGYTWSAAVTGTNGYYLGVYDSLVYPANSTSRAYGFPVRCVQHLYSFLQADFLIGVALTTVDVSVSK